LIILLVITLVLAIFRHSLFRKEYQGSQKPEAKPIARDRERKNTVVSKVKI
jgi:hypothetical protein